MARTDMRDGSDTRRRGRDEEDDEDDDKYRDSDDDGDDGDDSDGDDEEVEKALAFYRADQDRKREERAARRAARNGDSSEMVTSLDDLQKCIGRAVGEEFRKAVAPLIEDNKMLAAKVETLTKAYDDQTVAMEELADKFESLEKSIGEAPAKLKLEKAAETEDKGSVKETESAPNEGAKPEVLQKGAEAAVVSEDDGRKLIELMDKAEEIKLGGGQLAPGYNEAADALTAGKVTHEHIDALEKGLESVGALVAA